MSGHVGELLADLALLGDIGEEVNEIDLVLGVPGHLAHIVLDPGSAVRKVEPMLMW